MERKNGRREAEAMKEIDQTIVDFVAKNMETGALEAVDQVYVTNRLLDILHKQELEDVSPTIPLSETRLSLLDKLIDFAVQTELIEDLPSAKDVFGAQIMDLFTPKPSEVNRDFWNTYQQDPKAATDAFFELSKRTNYIKTREIAQNIEYTHETEFGQLDITINLSKPEKDPKEIALAKKAQAKYPSNLLCVENEGYTGHVTHPGRANHRIVRMDIKGDPWGFQYSPYAYYNEHAIFLSIEHRPMNVGIQAVKNLLEIITQLPHYFVGSNAGLPIVGGSILSHDHYQGGRYTFALEQAEEIHSFKLEDFPVVSASVVKWPMSVVRLSSEEKDELVRAADHVMNTWKDYSDESVGIHAYTEDTPHNAVTPIARRKGEAYELDLVLRNNRTSDEYPDGIFHPHPPVQHIKKENIGLIEVMGLAILPARLKAELEEVRRYLLGKVDTVKDIHQEWANELKETYGILTEEEKVEKIVQEEVGEIFLQVLKDAGVFKQDEQGQQAFMRFIQTLQSI